MAIFSYLATTALWTTTVVGAIGTTAAGVAIAAGQSIAWSIAGALLAQPKVSRQQMMATLSQTDMPRVRAYGRNLMGGLRVLYEADDGRLYQLVVIHHGGVDGLIRFWINGEPVDTAADGLVERYKYLYFRDGSDEGGDYPELYTEFSSLWTTDHRLQGQATFLS
ncbi:MAG: hypothetical protein L0G27_06850, partial [Paracoccus sp. (in: a-proteobacteria)]|nr:hypothetical protein [Paracoccus sp. (in: a-proteobacteria)]